MARVYLSDGSVADGGRAPGVLQDDGMSNVKSEQPAVKQLEKEFSKEDVVASPKVPLQSALKRGGTKRKSLSRISFVEHHTVKRIENVSRFVDVLWYPGFVVECDRCGESVQWGAEGCLMGAPGRSRFAQGQVLCNCCLADKLYAEIGAWVVLHLASVTEGTSGVAEVPVTSLLGSLVNLGSGGRGDLLVGLLGPEADDADVRTAVLRKAQLHAKLVLRQPTKVKREKVEENDLTPPSGSDLLVQEDDEDDRLDISCLPNRSETGQRHSKAKT